MYLFVKKVVAQDRSKKDSTKEEKHFKENGTINVLEFADKHATKEVKLYCSNK